MSLARLQDEWLCYGSGRRWRCCAHTRYVCEVDDAGTAPDYSHLPHVMGKLRRIKAFYTGRVALGRLDEFGTGLDILVANALTESLGSVPSPLNSDELRRVYHTATGSGCGIKLDAVVRHVALRAKYLERREPGYVNPVSTSGRVSLGAHHMLIETALCLQGRNVSPPDQRAAAIVELTCRLPAESLYAADLTVRYFNKAYAKHFNQPPLLAACYNAGSPRPAPANPWNLVQYGEHIDRWLRYYNTSRRV